jgi:serine/threonine protein kinase
VLVIPQDLFVQALELEPAAREAFLAQACGDDAELHLEVQRLLVDAERADSFFGGTDGATLGAEEFKETYAEKEGDVIGPYKLRQAIGEGGFGTVWMAQQSVPISRMVALKVIKAGMDTKQVLARFEAERQALAMMDHPHIAKVLDAGATPAGRPWFAMELVKGIPITEYCDEAGLGTKVRLALFRDVCSAINHAHQKGIIHRDIKPSNVMVTLHGDKPVVKVIDFGIAKATQGKLTDQTLFTRFEQFIGTPVYMSPEQAALSGLDIDTRSDIYALGILLYELLVGKPPFAAKTPVSAGYDEMRRIIREVEPPKPSSRLSTIVGAERTQLAKTHKIEEGKLSKLVEPDLDWIVMKAIEKDRSRRYETANGLAMDIQRFLTDEPVNARPPSAGYQLRKFARRHKGAFRAAAAMAALLLAGIAATSWQALRATRKAERANQAQQVAKQRLKESEQARTEAESISGFLTWMLESTRPGKDEGGRGVMVADVLDRAADKLRNELADHPVRRFKLQATIGTTYSYLGLHRKAIPLLEEAREYFEREDGPGYPGLLPLQCVLSSSYGITGNREREVQLREEHLRLNREVHGKTDYWTLRTMAILTGNYNLMGRDEDALQMRGDLIAVVEEMLANRRREHRMGDHEVINAMEFLAQSYNDIGRKQEALELLEELLALRRKFLGPEDRRTHGTIWHLSRSYFNAGRKKEALALREESLALVRKALKPNQEETTQAMNALAASYFDAGREKESLDLRGEVFEIRRKFFGPNHHLTLRARNSLAMWSVAAGRQTKAASLMRDVSINEMHDIYWMSEVVTLQAWLGMNAGHAANCRSMLEWIAGNEDTDQMWRVARLCCLLPSEDPVMVGSVLALARRAAVPGNGKALDRPWRLLALGMAEYRSGNFETAGNELRFAAEAILDNTWRPDLLRGIAGFYRVMCLSQLGKSAEAGILFDATKAGMRPIPQDGRNLHPTIEIDDLFLWLAYKEAKVLLAKPGGSP